MGAPLANAIDVVDLDERYGDAPTVGSRARLPASRAAGERTRLELLVAAGELARGATGPAVAELQRRLAVAGFPTSPDGQFGAKTEMALLSYQAEHRLPQSGRLDVDTLSALVDLVRLRAAGGACWSTEGPQGSDPDAGSRATSHLRLTGTFFRG